MLMEKYCHSSAGIVCCLVLEEEIAHESMYMLTEYAVF